MRSLLCFHRFPQYLEILAPETYTSVGKYNLYTGKKVSSGAGGQEKKAGGTAAAAKRAKAKAGGGGGEKATAAGGGNGGGGARQRQTGGAVGVGAERLILSELQAFVEMSVLKPFTHHVSCILGFGIEPLVYTPDVLPTGLTQATQATQALSGLTGDPRGSEEHVQQQQVTQLTDGAILKLLKSTVQWCSAGSGSGGYEESDALLTKVQTLHKHGVFQSLCTLVTRIQRSFQPGRAGMFEDSSSSSSGGGGGGESCLLESTEVLVDRDTHMLASAHREPGGGAGGHHFDILEQIVRLYGELLGSKAVLGDLISAGKSYSTAPSARHQHSAAVGFRVPLLIRISMDLSNNMEETGAGAPETCANLQVVATCYERGLQGIFDTFYSLVLGLLKHRASRSSSGEVCGHPGDEDTHIEFEEVSSEEPSVLQARARGGEGGGAGAGKTLTSRNDMYMTFVVSICHILDKLLDVSAQLLLTQASCVPEDREVYTALSALLAPTALPLQLAELCKSLLQYDWAGSRLKGGSGYTYSAKDLSLFVHLSLKHAPAPLEKVQFMVNDLFMEELKVRILLLTC
jgi:hypothetical protein